MSAGEEELKRLKGGSMERLDGRKADELRPVKIVRNFYPYTEGSVYFEAGNTWLIIAATVEDKVPSFLKGTGQGWITAEYGMLPRSAPSRIAREVGMRISGRSQEIRRLIGRSLRSVVSLESLGEKTILIDCDVIRADGGTRTAAVTGSFIALYDALQNLVQKGELLTLPIKEFVAAVSVGIVDGEPLLDLCYEEDFEAEVDMNVVMTENKKLVEIQGTAEKKSFSREELDILLSLAEKGIESLIAKQREALGLVG